MRYPKITIIMPAFREEEVIEDTLNHLLNEVVYPNLEIIVALDTKEDNTYNIVKKFVRKYKNVKMDYSEARRGIVVSVLSALKKATGSVIVKSDAEVRYVNPSTCMFNLIDYYKDPKVGGMTFIWKPYSSDISKEKSKGWAARGEIFINELASDWRVDNYHKMNKNWNLPLICNSFRKKLIKNIDSKAICDDAYYGYIILDKGYKLILANKILHYFVGVPTDAKRLFLQKRRGTIGWLRIRKERNVNLPKYYISLFGYFLSHFYKYSLEDAMAFFYWCAIFLWCNISATRKINVDQKDIWIKYKRDVKK